MMAARLDSNQHCISFRSSLWHTVLSGKKNQSQCKRDELKRICKIYNRRKTDLKFLRWYMLIAILVTVELQKHVLLFRKSEFLFFKVSNTNMPQFFFRNKTFLFAVRSLRYYGYLTKTWCVCQVAGISKRSDNLYFSTPHVTKRDVFLLATIRYIDLTVSYSLLPVICIINKYCSSDQIWSDQIDSWYVFTFESRLCSL